MFKYSLLRYWMLYKKVNIKWILLLGILLSVSDVCSQDGHYWTQQYGTRSMLLSGSVIGGVDDLGAVYYNPARLSQVDNIAFLLSADVYEYNRIQLEDVFGNNADAGSASFGGVPSLAAGTFKIPWLKNHYFAWAVLSRINADLNIAFRDEIEQDVIEDFPGEEIFGAEFKIGSKASENWTGVSWSHPLNDKLSLGASVFFSQSDYSKEISVLMHAKAEDNTVAQYRLNRTIGFNHYGLLWKLGASYVAPKYSIGLTVSTPIVKLGGDAKYDYEKLLSGLSEVSDKKDIYTTSYQESLKVERKKPWSIGLGTSINIKKSKLHFSAEWFSAIPEYSIFDAGTHYSQSTGDTIRFMLADRMKSVVNAGIGAEIYLNEHVSGYTSFSTDFSALYDNAKGFVTETDKAYNSIWSADFYHFGLGVVLKFKGADITLGGTYTGAKQYFDRPLDFPEEGKTEVNEGDKNTLMKWDRFRLVFSFSIPFLKDVQKKVEDKIGF